MQQVTNPWQAFRLLVSVCVAYRQSAKVQECQCMILRLVAMPFQTLKISAMPCACQVAQDTQLLLRETMNHVDAGTLHPKFYCQIRLPVGGGTLLCIVREVERCILICFCYHLQNSLQLAMRL